MYSPLYHTFFHYVSILANSKVQVFYLAEWEFSWVFVCSILLHTVLNQGNIGN